MDNIPFIDKIRSAFLDYPLPADLKFILILLAADIGLIYFPFYDVSSFRTVFLIPLLLFIPGFCCSAALFPRDGDLKFLERMYISIGISAAIDILTLTGLYFSPWAVQLDNLIIFLVMISVALIPIAHFRRAMLRNQDMVKVQFYKVVVAIRDAIFPSNSSRSDHLLRLILILALLTAVGATLFLIITPPVTDNFTEFYILGPDQKANNYPESLVTGQKYPVFLGVRNHEHRNVTYTIEVWNMQTVIDTVTDDTGNSSTNPADQSVQTPDDNETGMVRYSPSGNDINQETMSTRIVAMNPTDQVVLTLASNETRIVPYSLFGNNLDDNRVAFLLFKGTPPLSQVAGSDRINASYRNLFLRVTVHPGFSLENPVAAG